MSRLLVVFLAPLLISAEGNEQEDCLAAAVQQEGFDEATELLQVKGEAAESEQETMSEAEKVAEEAKDGEEWVHYNPPGMRGGAGHGYVHHNPPGWRGGPGHGTTAVHHNPPGWRGGPGHGTTVYHHHGYR